MMIEVDECSFDECGRAARVRGLCSAHYQQWREGKELTKLRVRSKRRACSFNECDRPTRAKGLCQSHYAQKVAGKELKPIAHRSNYGIANIPGPDSSLEDRIDAGTSRNPESGCLLWRRAVNQSGSPVISVDGRTTVLNRMAFERWFGVDPGSRHVLRVCGNKSCLEPGHMYVHGLGLGAEPHLNPKIDATAEPVDEDDPDGWWTVAYSIGGFVIRETEEMGRYDAKLLCGKFVATQESFDPPAEDWRAWGKHLWHERIKGRIETQNKPVR